MRRSRRAILQAGLCGLGGITLPELWQSHAQAAPAGNFGTAKRCLFIFLWGGPSHIDTLDPKPDAPDTIRGPFKPISTTTAGTQISELLPKIAAHSDKYAIIRSLNHSDPAHLSSAHAALTGQWAPVIRSDAEPPSDRDTPHLGSVMARLRPAPAGLPGFVTMPWLAYHPAAPGGKAPGQNGGWLGHQYDPMLVEGDPNAPNWQVPVLQLRDNVNHKRFTSRFDLLREIDQERQSLEQSLIGQQITQYQTQAADLLSSSKVREAFDLSAEPDVLRDRYGRNTHGQCVLLARRLVERGVPLVSVNWHNDNNPFWDTHGDNFNKLQNSLCPAADQALATLLEDLTERGLLEETLVVWVGEFGRAPVISNGTGREHHPFCYSGLLAGGGVQGGQVHGSSDERAFYPADNPVSQLEFTATLLHALGIPHDLTLPDHVNRPHRIYAADPLLPLLG